MNDIDPPKEEKETLEVVKLSTPLKEKEKEKFGFIKPSTFRVSFETSMIVFFVAIAVLSIYYIYNPQPLILTLTTLGILTIPTGIFIGFILSSNTRVKILRKITRKNFGFVKFVYGNLSIKTIVANLDKDIVNFSDGIYIVDKGKIKRELPEEYSDKSEKQPFKEIENTIRFEDGIPVIYFNVDDIIPLDFKEIPKADEDKYRIPAQTSATLNKEIAVEKAKALKQTQRRLNIIMIVGILALGGIGYMQYMIMDDIQTIGTPRIDKSQLNEITSGLADLSKKVESLTNQITELPSKIVKEAGG